MMRLKQLILCCLLLAQTSVTSGAEPTFQWQGRFPKQLSDWGVFADLPNHVPCAEAIPWDIRTPLFSDYAHKNRFMVLPKGRAMKYSATEAFEFPVGSILAKTFSYPHDFRAPEQGQRFVETRLLVHTAKRGWVGAAYLWDEDQQDARLSVTGTRVPVEWIHHDGRSRSTTYTVPNMNECRYCHAGYGYSLPLGLTARQLNRDLVDRTGHRENQLQNWAKNGWLTGLPQSDQVPQLAVWNDPASASVAERARGYLDANCAHCHNPDGLAGYKRIDLRFHQQDQLQRGIGLRSTGGHYAETGLEAVIVPGHPEQSFLYGRLKSVDFTFMMPQVGRSVVHEEGLQLMADWIRSLDPK